MKKLFSYTLAGILGLWLAEKIIKGVTITVLPTSNFFGLPLTNKWQIIVILGLVLGLFNTFLKPLLKTLSLPLEIITLGLFTILINMGFVWCLDLIFEELKIGLWLPLLFTTLIVQVFYLIINFFLFPL